MRIRLHSYVTFTLDGVLRSGYVHTLFESSARIKGGGYFDVTLPLSSLIPTADPISS